MRNVSDMTFGKIFEEREIYLCFERFGVLYLPHFTEVGWVSPAHALSKRIYSEAELRLLGAKPTIESLWGRLKHKAVTKRTLNILRETQREQ